MAESKKKTVKLTRSQKESIKVYGEGLRKELARHGLKRGEFASVWSLDDDDLQDDPDVQWLIGYFAGVAESHGVVEEVIFDLDAVPARAPARAKKAA